MQFERVQSTLVWIILTLLYIIPVQSIHAKSFRSTLDGSWSSPSTWGELETPRNGDTVVIQHQVSIDRDTVIGHSPQAGDATAAIHIMGGHLTIEAYKKLTCRGDARIHPGRLSLRSGSVLEMDASQATSPHSAVYRIDIIPTHGQNNALLSAQGTESAPCQIRKHPSGAHTRITDGDTPNGGRILADHCIFKGLGGHPDYQAWIYNPTGTGDLFRVTNSVFDECSQIRMSKTKYPWVIPKGGQVVFENCIWKNSLRKPDDGSEWEIFHTGAAPGAAAVLKKCRFDERVYLYQPNDYVIEDCVFEKGIYARFGEDTSGIWKSFKHNLVRWVKTPESEWEFSYGNTVEDCVLIKDTDNYNPHFASIRGASGPVYLRGNIIWYTGKAAQAEGDVWFVGPPSHGTRTSNTVHIERNIYLPNGNGPKGPNNISGTGFTILEESSVSKQVVFKRNTIYAGAEQGGCNVGETQRAFAGDVAYFKSNLFIGTLRADGTLCGDKLDNLGNAQPDVVLAANADYNAGFRIKKGTNGPGKGYNHLQFSGINAIGVNDIDDIDPNFEDDQRTPLTWDASLGGPGTFAGLANRLSIQGGNLQELIDYIKRGFRPRNTKLKNAGDPQDGSPDIGAVDLDTNPLSTPKDLKLLDL